MARILFKKSTTNKKKPNLDQLEIGELAINAADATIFYKTPSDEIITIGSPPVGSINGVSLTSGENIQLPSKIELDKKADVGHTHHIDAIDTSDELFFATQSQKQSIGSNFNIVTEHDLRVTEIENYIQETNGLVKLNEDSGLYTLSDVIDGKTIIVEDEQITAKSLSGLVIDPESLNLLAGVTKNIQGQLNSLTRLFNFTLAEPTLSALQAVPLVNVKQNDMAIVINDEMHNNSASIYVFVESAWEYAGAFRGGDQRDFSVEPIDLATETVGSVSTNLVEKQSARKTPIADSKNNFTVKNVEAALEQLTTAILDGQKRVSAILGEPFTSEYSLEVILQRLSDVRAIFIRNLLGKGVNVNNNATFKDFVSTITTMKRRGLSNIINSGPIELAANDVFTINVDELGQTFGTLCISILKMEQGLENTDYYSHTFNSPHKYSGSGVEYTINGAITKNRMVVKFNDQDSVEGITRTQAVIPQLPTSITL